MADDYVGNLVADQLAPAIEALSKVANNPERDISDILTAHNRTIHALVGVVGTLATEIDRLKHRPVSPG